MKKFNIKDIELIDKKEKPEALLTGEYIKGLSSESTIKPNAEIEKEEYLKFPGTQGEVQQVIGESHEKGGVKMSIPDGTKVLSDHLTLKKKHVKALKEEYGLKVDTKTTFAEVVEKYSAKIGLKKLNSEQEEAFASLKKEMQKEDVDQNTAKVNLEFISGKINSIEEKKKSLKQEQDSFFETVFGMQEGTKPKKELEAGAGEEDEDELEENEPEEGTQEDEEEDVEEGEEEDQMRRGGVSAQNFKALCEKYGLTAEQGNQILKDGGYMGLPKLEGDPDKSGIFIASDKMLPTGASLSAEQKKELLTYYRRHNPQLANAIDNAKVKWEDITLNPGLVQEAKKQGFLESVPVYEQTRDVSTDFLPKAKTYGNLSQERVSGFVLKDYYEATNPGKKFEDITKEEVGKLQQEYSKAMEASQNMNYFSGVRGEKEVADTYFGNRTSSYVRSIAKVEGTKSGTIDVDKLFTQTPAQIDAALKDYGLTAADLEKYKNAAYKYVQINPKGTAAAEEEAKKAPDKGKVAEGEPIVDTVQPTKNLTYPRLHFTPDQSALPPSPMDAHLKANIRLERIDPVRVGIENNLAEISNQRNFVTKQLEGLPEAQRAAVLANLMASSNKAANEAITNANITNAQNLSSAELFNIGQAGNEQMYAANNLLSFEQRQLTAKAKTDEELRRYYDYNRKVNIANFEDHQKLNLLESMFPDYKLDFMGTGVNFEPQSPFQLQDQQNLQDYYSFVAPQTEE